jgi:alpha-N-arabinofuranosidase
MTGKTVEAVNTIASPNGVTIAESKVAGTRTVMVPAISAAIYEMPIAAAP